MVQYLNEHSFRRQLQAALFLQRKDEDLNAFSDEYEPSSSEEVVNKPFDKMEFLNKFQWSMTEVMFPAMSQVISKLLEQPVKTCENKQCRKLKEKAMPPLKTACKTVCKVVCECVLTHTTWSNHSMWPYWCSDAPEHPQYPLGMKQAIKDNQGHPQYNTMDNNAATTRPLHHCTWAQDWVVTSAHPFKGVHPPLGTVKRPLVHSGPGGSHACCAATTKARCLWQRCSCNLRPHHTCALRSCCQCTWRSYAQWLCIAQPVHPNNGPYICTETTWPMHSKVVLYMHYNTCTTQPHSLWPPACRWCR